MAIQHIRVIDSHTAGEPTRVVIAGAPDLGAGTLAERRERFRAHFDRFRCAVVNEPRGSDVMVGALLCPPADATCAAGVAGVGVGALLCPPADATCAAGVIFFNNVGYLGMCGHGLIGVIVTLGH